MQARNSLEGYLYDVRNKFMDHEEEVNAVSTEDQRSVVSPSINRRIEGGGRSNHNYYSSSSYYYYDD